MKALLTFEDEYGNDTKAYEVDVVTWTPINGGVPSANLYLKFPRGSSVPTEHEAVNIEVDGREFAVFQYDLSPQAKTTPQGNFKVATLGYVPEPAKGVGNNEGDSRS